MNILATSNKDFKIKNGLIVEGDSATVNGNDVLTSASSIDDLDDVNAATPNDGDALVYDLETQTWVPAEGAAGPPGIVAQDEPPSSTDILWLDTDEAAAQLAVADIPELPQSKTTNLVSDLGARPTTNTVQAWSNQLQTGIDTISRISLTSQTFLSGNIRYTFFTPLKNMTVSQITMVSGTTLASGLTLARMGLHTFDGTTITLVARTATDTTLFNATTTLFTRSFDTTDGFPATYELIAGQRYAVSVIITGTTMPSLGGNATVAVVTAIEPKTTGLRTTQTDLLTTDNSFTGIGVSYWARVS